MKKNILILLLSTLVFASCEKNQIATPTKSDLNEQLLPETIAGNESQLTSNQLSNLSDLLSDLEIYNDIDINSATKILLDSTTQSYAVKVRFNDVDSSYNKLFVILLHGDTYYSNTSKIVEVTIFNVNKGLLKITDFDTNYSVEFLTLNGETSQNDITGNGNRETWWECMVREFKYFTSTIAGSIAMGLYPEPILAAMSIKCGLTAN